MHYPLRYLFAMAATIIITLQPARSQPNPSLSKYTQCRTIAVEERVAKCSRRMRSCNSVECVYDTVCEPQSSSCERNITFGHMVFTGPTYCDRANSDNRDDSRENVIANICGKAEQLPEQPRSDQSAQNGLSIGEIAAGTAVVAGTLAILEQIFSTSEKPTNIESNIPTLSGQIFKDPKDFDIIVAENTDSETKVKEPRALWVFYGPNFNAFKSGFEIAEYYTISRRLILLNKDGRRFDIGARIGADLLHKQITLLKIMYMVQTQNGKPIHLSDLKLIVRQ